MMGEEVSPSRDEEGGARSSATVLRVIEQAIQDAPSCDRGRLRALLQAKSLAHADPAAAQKQLDDILYAEVLLGIGRGFPDGAGGPDAAAAGYAEEPDAAEAEGLRGQNVHLGGDASPEVGRTSSGHTISNSSAGHRDDTAGPGPGGEGGGDAGGSRAPQDGRRHTSGSGKLKDWQGVLCDLLADGKNDFYRIRQNMLFAVRLAQQNLLARSTVVPVELQRIYDSGSSAVQLQADLRSFVMEFARPLFRVCTRCSARRLVRRNPVPPLNRFSCGHTCCVFHVRLCKHGGWDEGKDWERLFPPVLLDVAATAPGCLQLRKRRRWDQLGAGELSESDNGSDPLEAGHDDDSPVLVVPERDSVIGPSRHVAGTGILPSKRSAPSVVQPHQLKRRAVAPGTALTAPLPGPEEEEDEDAIIGPPPDRTGREEGAGRRMVAGAAAAGVEVIGDEAEPSDEDDPFVGPPSLGLWAPLPAASGPSRTVHSVPRASLGAGQTASGLRAPGPPHHRAPTSEPSGVGPLLDRPPARKTFPVIMTGEDGRMRVIPYAGALMEGASGGSGGADPSDGAATTSRPRALLDLRPLGKARQRLLLRSAVAAMGATGQLPEDVITDLLPTGLSQSRPVFISALAAEGESALRGTGSGHGMAAVASSGRSGGVSGASGSRDRMPPQALAGSVVRVGVQAASMQEVHAQPRPQLLSRQRPQRPGLAVVGAGLDRHREGSDVQVAGDRSPEQAAGPAHAEPVVTMRSGSSRGVTLGASAGSSGLDGGFDDYTRGGPASVGPPQLGSVVVGLSRAPGAGGEGPTTSEASGPSGAALLRSGVLGGSGTPHPSPLRPALPSDPQQLPIQVHQLQQQYGIQQQLKLLALEQQLVLQQRLVQQHHQQQQRVHRHPRFVRLSNGQLAAAYGPAEPEGAGPVLDPFLAGLQPLPATEPVPLGLAGVGMGGLHRPTLDSALARPGLLSDEPPEIVVLPDGRRALVLPDTPSLELSFPVQAAALHTAQLTASGGGAISDRANAAAAAAAAAAASSAGGNGSAFGGGGGSAAAPGRVLRAMNDDDAPATQVLQPLVLRRRAESQDGDASGADALGLSGSGGGRASFWTHAPASLTGGGGGSRRSRPEYSIETDAMEVQQSPGTAATLQAVHAQRQPQSQGDVLLRAEPSVEQPRPHPLLRTQEQRQPQQQPQQQLWQQGLDLGQQQQGQGGGSTAEEPHDPGEAWQSREQGQRGRSTRSQSQTSFEELRGDVGGALVGMAGGPGAGGGSGGADTDTTGGMTVTHHRSQLQRRQLAGTGSAMTVDAAGAVKSAIMAAAAAAAASTLGRPVAPGAVAAATAAATFLAGLSGGSSRSTALVTAGHSTSLHAGSTVAPAAAAAVSPGVGASAPPAPVPPLPQPSPQSQPPQPPQQAVRMRMPNGRVFLVEPLQQPDGSGEGGGGSRAAAGGGASSSGAGGSVGATAGTSAGTTGAPSDANAAGAGGSVGGGGPSMHTHAAAEPAQSFQTVAPPPPARLPVRRKLPAPSDSTGSGATLGPAAATLGTAAAAANASSSAPSSSISSGVGLPVLGVVTSGSVGGAGPSGGSQGLRRLLLQPINASASELGLDARDLPRVQTGPSVSLPPPASGRTAATPAAAAAAPTAAAAAGAASRAAASVMTTAATMSRRSNVGPYGGTSVGGTAELTDGQQGGPLGGESGLGFRVSLRDDEEATGMSGLREPGVVVKEEPQTAPSGREADAERLAAAAAAAFVAAGGQSAGTAVAAVTCDPPAATAAAAAAVGAAAAGVAAEAAGAAAGGLPPPLTDADLETGPPGTLQTYLHAVLAYAMVPIARGVNPEAESLAPLFGGRPAWSTVTPHTVEWSSRILVLARGAADGSGPVRGVPLPLPADMELFSLCVDMPAELSPHMPAVMAISELRLRRDISVVLMKGSPIMGWPSPESTPHQREMLVRLAQTKMGILIYLDDLHDLVISPEEIDGSMLLVGAVVQRDTLATAPQLPQLEPPAAKPTGRDQGPGGSGSGAATPGAAPQAATAPTATAVTAMQGGAGRVTHSQSAQAEVEQAGPPSSAPPDGAA